MERQDWEKSIKQSSFNEIKLQSNLAQRFRNALERDGYEYVELPILDYAEKYVLNNDYSTVQNHFKSISSNGEVMSLCDDIIPGLISYSYASNQKQTKLCASREVYNFLPSQTKKVNEYQIGAVSIGSSDLETEAELIIGVYEYIVSLGITPKIQISNTNILQGLLNTYAAKIESRDRLKSIISGKIENDVDFAVSQTLNQIKGVIGGVEIVKTLSDNLNNKQSIEGILNILDVYNILDAAGYSSKAQINPMLLGNDPREKGLVFEILDEQNNTLAYGGRNDCQKGNEVIHSVYTKINVENILNILQGTTIFDDDHEVTIAIAPSREAIEKAYLLRAQFHSENIRTNLYYNMSEIQASDLMRTPTTTPIVYIDKNGNVFQNK